MSELAYTPHAACAILESYGLTMDQIGEVLKGIVERAEVDSSGYIKASVLHQYKYFAEV